MLNTTIGKKLLKFVKSERGTHEEYVTVHRQGKIFQRKQRVGRKEVNNNKDINKMSDEEIKDAFLKGKPLPLTVDKIEKPDRKHITIHFKEPGWRVYIVTHNIRKEKSNKNNRIVSQRKYYKNTTMTLQKDKTTVAQYYPNAIRVESGDKEAEAKLERRSNLIAKRIKNSFGVDLDYDSEGHVFRLKNEKSNEPKIDHKEEEKIDTSDAMKIKDELMSFIKNKKVNDLFDKPEIGYKYVKQIMGVKDKVLSHVAEKDIFGEYSDASIGFEAGRRIMELPKEDAYNYIKDPNNKSKIAKLFNTFVKEAKV